MSQVTGKKVATTPMPTPTGTSGNIIDSFNTQDDQTVNAPSIHIVKDALTTINDNLSLYPEYSNTNVTTLVDLLDAFIASRDFTDGKTIFIGLKNGNDLFYKVEITRRNNKYMGIATSWTDINDRYTFLKAGGASTEISPFSKLEADLLFFSMYEQQKSGGDLFIYNNLYAPYGGRGDANAIFTNTGWSGDNLGKTLTLTALKNVKIRAKGEYQFNKWLNGYNCYVEIKHNNVSLSRYDSTAQETKYFDVDVEVNLQVGDTLTFHRDQVFFTFNGVFSFIPLN